MNIKLLSQQEETTIKIGRIIGENLNGGTIIALTGDLGAGKTTFSKGIALGLRIKEPVTSPTYTIVHEYEGRLPLYHFDTYRIGDCEEMYDIGFDEYLYGKGVCLIEWPQHIEELLPDSCISISIQRMVDINSREISIEFPTMGQEGLMLRIIHSLQEEGYHDIGKTK